MGVVGGAGVDREAHFGRQRHVELVLVVPHRQLVILCRRTQRAQQLRKESRQVLNKIAALTIKFCLLKHMHYAEEMCVPAP